MVKSLHFLIQFLTIAFLYSCGTEAALKQEYLEEGIWRGIIKTQGQELPFNFEVVREDSVTYLLYIINGEERIEIRGLAMQGDSVFIPMHIYDAGIKGKLVNRKIIGIYEKFYEENSALPFEAVHNQPYRFPLNKKLSPINISGNWEVTFTDENEEIPAIGIFKQQENKIEGTFITAQGDFRYLDGVVTENKLWMSTFDGENAFLFNAEALNENNIQGHFWSGPFHYKAWKARRNNNAIVPEISKEKIIQEGFEKFNFKLTDLNGKIITLSDAKYEGKLKVIQIFGTWSPNCIDEVRFLTEWKKQNKNLDVAIIGLAFEQKDDFNYAKSRINKMAKRYNAEYEFLIAGTADIESASEKFSSLKTIEAFPTTLILDKSNNIRHINSGFRGPATGIYHIEYQKKFNDWIQFLLLDNNGSPSMVKK